MKRDTRENHQAWMTAEQALAIRPDQPDGHWDGRPYFFLPLGTKETPKAGYHIWHDVNLQDWVDRKDSFDIDFLVDISIALQIRGGLASVLAESIGSSQLSLEGIHTEATISSLRELIIINSPKLKLKNASWLDIASGNGVVTSSVGSDSGIALITHIDPSKDAYEQFKYRRKIEQSSVQEIFIRKKIEDVVPSSLLGTNYNGVFIINPWPDHSLISSSFSISRSIAKQNSFKIVSLVDRSDEAILVNGAVDAGFSVEKRTNIDSSIGFLFGLAR